MRNKRSGVHQLHQSPDRSTEWITEQGVLRPSLFRQIPERDTSADRNLLESSYTDQGTESNQLHHLG